MSKSVEQDAIKSKKRIKIAKIAAIVAAMAIVGWTIYSVAMNLNQSERLVVNSFIKAFSETEAPASNELVDCSRIYEGETAQGKAFEYVMARIRQSDNEQIYLLVVDGKGNGKCYSQQTLALMDFPAKENVRFEISERNESLHLAKMQKTLLRYWQFHDVA